MFLRKTTSRKEELNKVIKQINNQTIFLKSLNTMRKQLQNEIDFLKTEIDNLKRKTIKLR